MGLGGTVDMIAMYQSINGIIDSGRIGRERERKVQDQI